MTGAAVSLRRILATIVGLCLMFYGEPYFWMAWFVGGLLCGVAALIPALVSSLAKVQ